MKPSPRTFVFRRATLTGAALALALASLTGCNVLPEPKPDNTRHYVLESPARDDVAPPANAPRIGLRPVEVPAYLRQKTIVVRTGENELRYARDARWAEPLEAGLTRVLRDQLAAGARVVAYPFPGQVERDYDLTVQVLNAEGTNDGIRFVAVFELLRLGDRPALVVRKEFRANGAAWKGDHGRLAAELSAAVAELAREILRAVPSEAR